MKNRERNDNRNKFLAEKLYRVNRAGTIHRNGVSSINCKDARLSCSYVPTLPFTLKKIDIGGCERANRLYTRVKGFVGLENNYGRSA